MTDTLTIIRARRGKRLAKLVRADGTIGDYDNAYSYDLLPQSVADLNDVLQLLHRLIGRSDCAVVRGVPIDPERSFGVRRLAFADRATGDAPTLAAATHEWLALDVDGVERPADVAATDLIGCARSVTQRLPGAFHGVRGIAQASGSHGIKPGCRLRLWYWLDRPVAGDELSRWLRGAPIDPCVFRTVQPIYTAAPVFAEGVRDHLPERIVTLPGRPVVSVPSPAALTPPPPRPAVPLPNKTDAGSGRYAFAALTNAAVRVHRAGIGDRHFTILREARGLARFIGAGLLTVSDIKATLRDAGMNTGKPEDEIESIVTWALEHPSGGTLPEGVVR